MIDFEQFILDFKNSKYWSLLFEKYEVLMVQVVGSQLTGYVDDRSDVDIIVFCYNSPLEQEDSLLRLRYQGHSVHWYYRNYSNFFELSSKNYLSHTHGYTLRYLTNDKILYVSKKFNEALDFLMENSYYISTIAAKRLAIIFSTFVSDVLKNHLSKPYYTKWLSHLLMCYGVLSDKRIEYDLLMAIKRIRWCPTSALQRIQCCDILRKLQTIVSRDDFTVLTNELKKYTDQVTKLVK